MDHRRNIALDLVLTLLLCGLWNLVVQHHQIKVLNILLKEERFSYWKLYGLSLVTCGIYFIYFEYKKAEAFQVFMNGIKPGTVDSSDPVLAAVLSIIGFNWVYDAILQTKLNDYWNEQAKDFTASP